jgi:DNA replication protein DnaC
MIATPPTATRCCPRCDAEMPEAALWIWSICANCLERSQATVREEEEQRVKSERQQAKRDAWAKIVPLDYQKTDWNHPGLHPTCQTLAKDWNPAWNAEERGLGIVGPTGVGKTRAAYAILTRLHFSGIPVAAIDAIDFATAASSYNDDDRADRAAARALIERVKTVRVLLLDDIGKDPATPRTNAALHDLLEKRNQRHLPTIWTSERVGSELAAMFGNNYADGILRRLRGNHQIHVIKP